MASSRVETQITWSSAASITLNSATQQDSDTFTIDAETYDWAIQVSADNAGTPASGDVVNVFLKASAGDILGDSGDDYDTNKGARLIAVCNTFSTDSTGEDPQRRTAQNLPTGAGKYRLSVVAPQGASRNIVFRARLVEHKVA